MTGEISLRDARFQDAGAIAALHVLSWRSAYRGILPDDYLDGEVEPERLAHWERTLTKFGAKDMVLLAEREGVLIGFASVYWGKEPSFDSYLDNLHVQPGLRGGRLGKLFLGNAVERLIENGAANLCLWAFDQNEGAIRFYERLGGKLTDHGFDDIGGKGAPELTPPLKVTGEVLLLSEGDFICEGPMWKGVKFSMGPTAVLQIDGVEVIVSSVPTAVMDLQVFRSVGIEPSEKSTLAVKSRNHFRAAYEPLAREVILVDAGGIASMLLNKLPYKNIPRPIWPLDEISP